MLKKINFFTDVKAESNISDVIQYGNVSFKKPSVKISLVVEDEYGNEVLQDYEVKIYNITNVIFKSDNTCSFSVKSLTTNSDLKIRLEIIDSNTRLYGVTEFVDFKTSANNSLSLSFKNFDIRTNSNLYYRFYIKNKTLSIEDYFPSSNGTNENTTFNIITNNINTKLKSAVYPIGYNKKELEIKSDIINRLNLNNVTNVKTMLDIYTNPSEYKTINLSGNNYYEYYKQTPLNNYGIQIKGINGNTMEFNIPEINHTTFDRYKFKIFSNGLKILDDNYKSQNSYDGLGKLYISDNLLKKDSDIEIQSIKNFLNETERFNYVFEIDSMEMITKLHNEGFIIDNFFYDPNLLTCYILRDINNGLYRINLNRFYISKYSDTQLKLIILDSLYNLKIGDKIYITSDLLYDREVLTSNTTRINDGSNSYLKPTFFIPFSFITINNNIITDLSLVTNQTEIYINGLCAVPNDDYVILGKNDTLNLPSIILFKNLLFGNTKIEIIFNGNNINDSTYYLNDTTNRTKFNFTLNNLKYPLIDGCYDVYSNNYKVPNSIIKTISKNKFCILNDGITRNISPNNIYIKFNYNNNMITETLLNKYKTMSDSEVSTNGLNILSVSETLNSKGLNFAEFVWNLDENINANKLKDIYELLKKENHANILDCNQNNIVSGSDFIPSDGNLPYLFNHVVNIHSFSILNEKNFKDNISIINPSRILQISDINEKKELNCNIENEYQYDVFLNEDIPMNIDYINNDINIDCNKAFK